MTPSEQHLPARVTVQIIRRLQEVDAPQIFTPRAAYDGRKNLFSVRRLPFTEDTHTVSPQYIQSGTRYIDSDSLMSFLGTHLAPGLSQVEGPRNRTKLH